MKIDDFYNYIDDMYSLSDESFSDIENLSNEFPYFAAVKFIYLKNILKVKDNNFPEKNEYEMFYLPDRRKLFLLIENTYIKSEDKLVDFDKIDSFLYLHGKNNETDTLLETATTSDYFVRIEENNFPENITGWEKLNSFIVDNEKTERFRKKIRKDLLIDNQTHLLVSNPSVSEKEDLFSTESLAQVYIAQGKYEHALKIFEQLRLNYPEKEDYFATRISDLEKYL
ncbi:MAG: hypothetical protein LBU03_02635 [Tannerellaceae bacterium]|jgi:tetratricopeptide (TPR) repeat protein|nr:hypothetical protein [Tannerellaceae bacterium]